MIEEVIDPHPTLATAFEPLVRRNWFRALVPKASLETADVAVLDTFYREEAEKNGNPIPPEATRTEAYGGYEVPGNVAADDYVQWQWDWWIVEFQDDPISTKRYRDLTTEQ